MCNVSSEITKLHKQSRYVGLEVRRSTFLIVTPTILLEIVMRTHVYVICVKFSESVLHISPEKRKKHVFLSPPGASFVEIRFVFS